MATDLESEHGPAGAGAGAGPAAGGGGGGGEHNGGGGGDRHGGDRGEGASPGAEAGPGRERGGAPARQIHRLRDLSRQGKVVAGLVAVALVSAHALAVAHYWGDWMPGGDVALMGIRSLDAFTSATPLVGQPSTSGLYGGLRRHAFHPGPMQFYMSGPVIRLIGPSVGMMAVAVLVSASSALVSAWALFRQLGAAAGVVAAVVVGAIAFTTGPAMLVNPISSVVSGAPLLCGAVLVYCLLCGDDRLLPLAVVYLSFAGQAHLAVGPTVGFLVVAGLVGVAVTWWRAGIRHDAAVRRHALRWGGGALVLGAALWLPVAYQQVTGDPGNVTALVEFTSDSERPALGPESAVRQVAHTLGMPPMLGKADLTGRDFIAPVSGFTWVTAAAVLALLVLAGLRWRTSAPRRSALVVMVGVLVAAALATGSSVPASLESGRRSFYHWAWPMTLFAALALVLLAAGAVAPAAGRRLSAPARRVLSTAGVIVALAAMVVPSAVGLTMDRRLNSLQTAGTTHSAGVWSSLIDATVDAGIGDVDGKLVVIHKYAKLFDGTQEALSLELMHRGYDVGFPGWMRDYVHNEHIVTPESLGAVVLVVTEGLNGPPPDLPGREVGSVPLVVGFDPRALDEVLAIVEGTEPADVVAGPEMEERLAGLSEVERTLVMAQLRDMFREPEVAFANPRAVDYLLEYPPAEPEIDRDALVRLSRSLDVVGDVDPEATTLSVRLVEGAEAYEFMNMRPPAG